MFKYRPLTYEMAQELNDWLRADNVKKFAMFDNTFTSEFDYYQSSESNFPGKIATFQFAVQMNGVTIGYLALTLCQNYDLNYLCINPIIVDPKVQGQGYGSAIVEELERSAHLLIGYQVDYLQCMVAKCNAAAVRIFQKNSFEFFESQTEGYYNLRYRY